MGQSKQTKVHVMMNAMTDHFENLKNKEGINLQTFMTVKGQKIPTVEDVFK